MEIEASDAAQGEICLGSGDRKKGKKRGKKKLPVPDLDAISDPLEHQKQRRLIKNRNTAAASRQMPFVVCIAVNKVCSLC